MFMLQSVFDFVGRSQTDAVDVNVVALGIQINLSQIVVVILAPDGIISLG